MALDCPSDLRRCLTAVCERDGHRFEASLADIRFGDASELGRIAGFENFDWPSLAEVRAELERLGIGYGETGRGAGRFYEYPGDPLVSGVGTPVSHTTPA